MALITRWWENNLPGLIQRWESPLIFGQTFGDVFFLLVCFVMYRYIFIPLLLLLGETFHSLLPPEDNLPKPARELNKIKRTTPKRKYEEIEEKLSV